MGQIYSFCISSFYTISYQRAGFEIFRKNKDGLPGRYKIVGQVALGLFVGLTLYLSPDATIRENIETQRRGNVTEIVHKSEAVKSTKTTIPFVKNNNFDYADLVGFLGKYKTQAGWIVFVLITIFVITAVSNGANLNDGMDGMAAGNSGSARVAQGLQKTSQLWSKPPCRRSGS